MSHLKVLMRSGQICILEGTRTAVRERGWEWEWEWVGLSLTVQTVPQECTNKGIHT